MVVLSIVLFGLISFQRLPRNLMPDISYPTVTVRTEYPGAAPIDVEKRVSRRLEEVLSQVRNLRRISSVSRKEASDVILEFTWDTDMSLATTDVREKVAQAILPDEAGKPNILRYDPTLDPILQIGLYREGDVSRTARQGENQALVELRILAEDLIERELETVPGVAGVQVRGGLEPEIRLEVDESLLRAKSVSLDLINRRLREENLNLASGIIYEGDSSRVVRTVNEFASIEEIRQIILRRDEAVPVRLRDVARVEFSYAEPEVITRINGAPCVKIDIFKEADANLVEVAQRVRQKTFGTPGEQKLVAAIDAAAVSGKAASESLKSSEGDAEAARGDMGAAMALSGVARPRYLEARIPGGVGIEVMSDQSVFIENSLRDVRQTVVLGGLLAILVLYLFLRNGGFTLAVGLSIPLSVIAAFIAMHLFGVSLNMMSLGGLALGIGMLVDNSIVVLESIFRCREEGDGPREAAVRGTRTVASAVTASTLTTVAVFFPIVFVEGIAGQIFRDQALTVVISLVASLGTALWFIPALVCRRLGAEERRGGRPSASRLLRSTIRRSPWREFRQAASKLRIHPSFLWRLPALFVWDFPCLLFRWIGKWLFALLLSLVVLVRWVFVGIRRAGGGIWGRVTGSLFAVFDRLLAMIQAVYQRVLSGALDYWAVVVVLALLSAAGTVWLSLRLDSELIPEVHQGEFTVDVRLPRATRIERTDEVLRPWEKKLLEPGVLENVESVTTTIGVAADDIRAGDEGEHTAKILVRLRPEGDPEALELRVKERIRSLLEDAEFESIEFRNPVLFSFKTPIEVEVRGHNLADLENVTSWIESRMEEIEEIKDVRSNLARGAPEVQIRLDREALSRYGLTMSQVGDVVRRKLQGEVPTWYTLADRKVPIRARLEEEDRDSLGELSELVINPGAEREYRLRDVILQEDFYSDASGERVLDIGDGPAEIRRVAHQRAAVVTANLAGMSLGTATERVREVLDSLRPETSSGIRESVARAGGERGDEFVDPDEPPLVPAEFSVGFGGQKEEMDLASNSLERALYLAIFLVFVVMAMQFESLLQPLVIIVAIPLALVGVVPVLWLLDISLSIVVFIGLIVLAGIVVNNAIVLIDTANQLHRGGLPMRDALLQAGQLRLRPILMTTLTTVLGLLPLTGVLNGVPGLGALLGTGEGAEIRAPLAITVVAGLSVATVLTLVVIPVIAYLFDSGLERLSGRTEKSPDAG